MKTWTWDRRKATRLHKMSGVQRYFDAQVNIHKLVDASYSKSVPLCHRWCYKKIMVRFFFPWSHLNLMGFFGSFTFYWLLRDVTKSQTIQTFWGSETIFFKMCNACRPVQTNAVYFSTVFSEVSQDLKITVWSTLRFFLSESAAA